MDDVNILRQACCALRNLFLKIVKIDPFRQAITISSIYNMVSRTKFLKPESVGIFLRTGTALWIASLLSLFNGWRTLVRRVIMFLMPVVGGKSVCPGYVM